MKVRKRPCLVICLLLCSGAVATLLLLCDAAAGAQAATRYVAPRGKCGNNAPCYATIQRAVDEANHGDVIKVAQGVYTGVHRRPVPAGYPDPPVDNLIAQVVYLDKSLTIVGGYTKAFAEPPDWDANPTTLDAGGQGRVLFIAGDISPTIEGLRITGGEPTKLGGGIWGMGDVGGGVYVLTASVTLRHSRVMSNTVPIYAGTGQGAGLYLYGSDATFVANEISRNTVNGYHQGLGGGLALHASKAVFTGNTISQNQAGGKYSGEGGGLYLDDSHVTLLSNRIEDNGTGGFYDSYGGGLMLSGGTATLWDNDIVSNRASSGLNGGGGGLALEGSQATLRGNRISANVASGEFLGGGGIYASGGATTLLDNIITENRASQEGSGGGGGLYLQKASAILSRDILTGNLSGYAGGALHLDTGHLTATNNIIVENQSGGPGSGLYVGDGSLSLVHSTLAHNDGGDGSGLHVAYGSTVDLINTILVSHTVGISAATGSNVTLESTLWYNNGANWAGPGTIDSSHDFTGDPDLVAPNLGDYHIGPDSEALDRGTDAGVAMDIDYQPRPYQAPDLGADEYWPPGELARACLPLILRGGP